jgi:hypothetical protein
MAIVTVTTKIEQKREEDHEGQWGGANTTEVTVRGE